MREDILPDVPFSPLNVGDGYGFLRLMSMEERPDPRDVVIYETIPNELSRVAGLITTVPQTPLSHVNLRAVQDGVPNAFIRDALDDGDIDDLIGHIRPLQRHGGRLLHPRRHSRRSRGLLRRFAPSRNPDAGTGSHSHPDHRPGRHRLRRLECVRRQGGQRGRAADAGVPDGTVPDGFAAPFYFYDEFMKHNGFYDDIEEMLEDPDFQSDYGTQEKELKKLRKKIKQGETPDWIIDALEEMQATYPEGQSLRYRSSTNTKTCQGFSGAGLYDSKTRTRRRRRRTASTSPSKGCGPACGTSGHSLNASSTASTTWRRPWGCWCIPTTRMSWPTAWPSASTLSTETEGSYYVNTQLGEDLVTNPDAHSVPEEILLDLSGSYTTLATSNQVPGGQLLLSDAQIGQLRRHLQAIHDHFEGLYDPGPDEPFAMEIEFKITSDDVLSIKQARPWVFGVPTSAEASGTPQEEPIWSATLTVGIGENFAGYTTFLSSPETNTLGALSSNTITLDNTSYTVRALGVLNGKLILSVMPKLTADFVLVVGTDEFASTDASTLEGDSISIIQFQWNDPGLNLPEGKEVAVRVTEPAENTPALGAPTIIGTAQEDDMLTADTSGIEDADGLANASYSYQWVRNDGVSDTEIEDATDSAYTVTDDDVGKTIKVRVTFTDDADNQESLTSDATGPVIAAPNRQATGKPTIDGTARVGQTLTADTSNISDLDGITNATFFYQWRAGGLTISGATRSTYTLTANEQGKTVTVRVRFVDDRNNIESRASDATEEVAAAPNRDATGAPTITGMPQVGQTLTADTSNIADQDGLSNVSYGYRWIAGGSDIDGANGSTYTLSEDDVGKTIRVRVSFTDDSGNRESLTSSATAVVAAAPEGNSPATGAPAIGGTLQVGETLTASTSGIADQDGLDDVSYGYQWIAGGSDVGGATGSTYTLTSSEQGQTIRVRVTFTDDAGNAESLASAATAQVEARPNTPATSQPTITGTPQVGETLTADTSGISDDDGLTNVSYSYQWMADGVDIQNATSSTYKLVFPDQGKTIKVKVSFTDDRDNEETLTSAATVAVTAAANRGATGQPTISGTPQVGQTLTADTANIADEDGLDDVSYGYQWVSGGTDIDGATGSSYELTSSEQGQTIQVRVTFTDDRDNEETLTSAATVAVTAAANRDATGQPTISGTPRVDQTLTADTANIVDQDGLTNVSYSYQWIAGGSDIGGATGSTHTLTASEQGQTIQVRVTFTDDADNEESLTSIATAEVAAAPVPLTVSVTVSAPATHDGSSEFTFEIEFSEEFGISYATLRDHAFNVTGGSVERAQRTDKPSNIPWLITVKPQGTGGRDHRPARHHGLRSRRRHLHRGRQETLQLAERHRIGAGRLGAAGCGQHCRPHTWTSGRAHRHARTGAHPTWERLRRRHLAPPAIVLRPPPHVLDAPAGEGPGELLREDRLDAETAHTSQQKNLRLPRRLPGAPGALQGGVGPAVGGDRPPPGEPIPTP